MYLQLLDTLFAVFLAHFAGGGAVLHNPLEGCSSPEELCFGRPAEYTVKENSPARLLGALGPARCGDRTTTYTLIEGGGNASVRGGQLWSAALLDREVSQAVPLAVSCHPSGSDSRYDRLVLLTVQDEDDNLPLPPALPVSLFWNLDNTALGYIEIIDLDSVEVNSFTVDVVSDRLKIVDVNFTVKSRQMGELTVTAINISLSLRLGSVISTPLYSVDLRVTDTNHPPPNIVTFTVELSPVLPEPLLVQPALLPPPEALSQTRPLVQYPETALNLSRAASRHARVAAPLDAASLDSKTGPVFTLNHPALNVTARAGLVYVANTSALQLAPGVIKLTVQWRETGGRQDSAQLLVRLVDSAPCRDHDHEDNLCSSLTQRECLKTTCAYGLGRLSGPNSTKPRCEWVWDSTRSPMAGYSTCTTDSASCPDDWCDPLERLSGNLTCLQDCTQRVLGAGRVHFERGHGIRALTSPTFCSCDHFKSCACTGSPLGGGGQKKVLKVPKNIMKSDQPSSNTTANMANVTVVSRATQTPTNVNTTTLYLIPEPKSRRKDGCGFKCQTKAGIGIIFIMSSCLFLLVLLTSRRQKKKRSRKVVKSSNTLLQTLETHRAVDILHLEPLPPFGSTHEEPFIVPDPRWEFPRDSLVIEQCLGEGEFGRVLKARANNIDGVKGETIVAVKTLKMNSTPVEMADLLAEYQMMKDVSHPHVIRLLGACTSQGGPVYIIIEYAEHGSLRTYLRRSRLACPDPSVPVVEPISFKTLLSFARQIAKGMSYLAENKLVHRDLAARNVLLAGGLLCKISDFGLSRDVYEDEAYLKRSKGRVPVKWMALESLADHVYTTKSDVWSYGVVLWELVTLGSSPYPGVAVHNLFHLLKVGYRMQQPHTCTDSLYELMVSCWHEDPMERPPFWQITAHLEKVMEAGADYLPLQLEKRLVINRGYLAEFSPEDDIDITKEDFGYKVPKAQKVENELKQTSLVKRYENEEPITVHTDHYDTPRKLAKTNTNPNNLGCQHYTVPKKRFPNQYQNDTQLNINTGRLQSEKEIKYETKKLNIDNKDARVENEVIHRRVGIRGSDSGYVTMDTTRRVSCVDPRSSGTSTDTDTINIRRASSADCRTSGYTKHCRPRPASLEDNNAVGNENPSLKSTSLKDDNAAFREISVCNNVAELSDGGHNTTDDTQNGATLVSIDVDTRPVYGDDTNISLSENNIG